MPERNVNILDVEKRKTRNGENFYYAMIVDADNEAVIAESFLNARAGKHVYDKFQIAKEKAEGTGKYPVLESTVTTVVEENTELGLKQEHVAWNEGYGKLKPGLVSDLSDFKVSSVVTPSYSVDDLGIPDAKQKVHHDVMTSNFMQPDSMLTGIIELGDLRNDNYGMRFVTDAFKSQAGNKLTYYPERQELPEELTDALFEQLAESEFGDKAYGEKLKYTADYYRHKNLEGNFMDMVTDIKEFAEVLDLSNDELFGVGQENAEMLRCDWYKDESFESRPFQHVYDVVDFGHDYAGEQGRFRRINDLGTGGKNIRRVEFNYVQEVSIGREEDGRPTMRFDGVSEEWHRDFNGRYDFELKVDDDISRSKRAEVKSILNHTKDDMPLDVDAEFAKTLRLDFKKEKNLEKEDESLEL